MNYSFICPHEEVANSLYIWYIERDQIENGIVNMKVWERKSSFKHRTQYVRGKNYRCRNQEVKG